MANAQKGRIACVDLDDDRARALFSDALPLAKRLGDLLPYPELSFRRRGRWSDLYKHRGFLSDAFKASEGYLLRQRVLHKQMADFSRNRDIAGSPAEIEALCYRIRAMMSHLREAKLKAFKIPERFESLSSTLFHVKISPPLLDGVSLKDGDGMGLKDRIVEYDDDDDQGDLSNDVEEMTPRLNDITVVGISSDSEVDVDDLCSISSDSEVDVDDLCSKLFQPKKKPKPSTTTRTPPTTPPSASKTCLANNEEDDLDYDYIDKLVAGCKETSFAPVGREYLQIFKRPSSNCVLKKPAANKGKTECIDGKKSEGIKSKTDIECILVKSLKKSL